MSNIVYNRYQGRFYPSAGGSGTLSVDAPSMSVAIQLMTAKKGGVEPTSVSLLETQVMIAASAPTASFTTQVYAEDVMTPAAGNIFPSSATLPIGNLVVINAVPNEGYEFLRFEDQSGKVLSQNKEYQFTMAVDTEIKGIFKKTAINPEDISIDPTLSKLLRVNRDDGNYEDSQYNQDHVALSQTFDENTNTIYATFLGELSELHAFTSTNPAQAQSPKKWLGLVIDTNEDYRKCGGIYYNNIKLDVSDFKEANDLGIIGNGAFILWVKGDEISQTPKKVSVYTQEKQKKLWIVVGFQNV